MKSERSIFIFPDRPQTNYYYNGDFSQMLNEVQLTEEASLKFHALITPIFNAFCNTEFVTISSQGDYETTPFADLLHLQKKRRFLN